MLPFQRGMIRLARETLEIGEGVDVDSALSLHPGVSEAAIAVVYRIPIKYLEAGDDGCG